MKFSALIVVAAWFLGCSICSAERIHSFHSGAWKGGAFTRDTTGKFSFCSISAQCKSGKELVFMLTADSRFFLLIRSPKWNLDKGVKYPVRIQIDGASLGERTATSVSKQSVSIFFGNDRPLIRRLRQGRRLKVHTARLVFSFSLAGTGRALTRMRECVETAVALSAPKAPVTRKSDSNPFASPKPRAETRSIPQVTSKSEDSTPMLRRLLKASGVRDPQFFDPGARWNLPRGTYGWMDDGVIGLHVAVNRKSQPVRAPVTEALAAFGGSCDGKFATAIKPTTTSGRYGITDGVGQCGGGKDSTAVFITALSLERSVFLFIHVGFGDETFMAEAKAARLKEVLIELMAGKS